MIRNLRIRARRLWLRWTGRCTMCAGKRIRCKPEAFPRGCYHCKSHEEWCHVCNKRINFGSLYGAGPKTLERLMTYDHRVGRPIGG